MVRFINIETGKLYTFESWDKIIKLGGLKTIFSGEDWNNIYNEAACIETVNQVSFDIVLASSNDSVRICCRNSTVNKLEAKVFLQPFKKVIELFNNNN